MISASDIKDHMEVKSADGQHIGTVDYLEGSESINLRSRILQTENITISFPWSGSTTSTHTFIFQGTHPTSAPNGRICRTKQQGLRLIGRGPFRMSHNLAHDFLSLSNSICGRLPVASVFCRYF